MKISNTELLRYAKQIILKKIGISGQKKISAAKVLITGVGGLGCPLALYLANTGIGNIGIIDNDKVDISNLNRQVLFNTDDIGKHKVVQAKKVTNKNRSELHVIANDVRDCLKKANEVFFKQFNFNAKSIEVSSPITNQVSKDLLEFAKTSNSMITMNYDQKASA